MSNRKLFIYSFSFMIIIRATALCTFRQYIPYTELYILYMFFWGAAILAKQHGKLIISGNKVLFVVASLAVYDIVFAFSNISVLDRGDVISTMARSLMMVVFVCVSAYGIYLYGCLKSVIRMTYLFLATFMTVLFVVYMPQTNLSATIASFWNQFGNMRYRNLFGFIVNNVAAEHALSVILLSLFVLHEYYPKEKKSIKRTIILIDDVMMFLMIIANNSRGTLVVSIMMLCVYTFIKMVKKNGVKKAVRISIVGIVCIIIGMVYYLQKTGQDLATFLYFTNRMHFIANLEILKKSGRWLMGLGRTSGAFLANKNILYGLQTDYMEIFYASVFIQTGIIGAIWIFYILFTIGKEIYSRNKKSNTYLDKWIFIVFYYTLVLSLFEDYALSSLYITSTCFLTMMVAYCMGKNRITE